MWLEVSQFLMVCVRWCVLCQAAGQRQRALSVWSGPQRVRSAAVSNITTSSTVAPSLLVRRGRWRRARCLFVCFFVERQLWGSTGFRRHSGLTCAAKTNRERNVVGGENVSLGVAQLGAQGSISSERMMSAVLSGELQRWNNNNQSASASTLRCRIRTLCSLERSYTHQLPLESSSC